MGNESFFPEGGESTPADGAEALARRLSGEGAPGADAEADLGLRIGRDGTWYYRGTPIQRPALVKLFASVLRRDEAGAHWLVTPVERGRIAVEDAPFVAVELRAEGAGPAQRLDLRTNLDRWVEVGPDHPLDVRDAAGGAAPYVALERGLEARLNRSVYYELVELGVPEQGGRRFGVWSRDRFFPLGEAEE
jgi:uncharacterized protein